MNTSLTSSCRSIQARRSSWAHVPVSCITSISTTHGTPGQPPIKIATFVCACLLFSSIGDYVGSKHLYTYTPKLWREKGDVRQVARTFSYLSDANRMLGQAKCFIALAWALYEYNQTDATEEAAPHSSLRTANNIRSGNGLRPSLHRHWRKICCQEDGDLGR